MATTSQIEANRRNALKSTGPRTPEGQAVSRLNALKTGIDARSQVIPGESPEDLETLALDYHHRFHPDAPEQSFLVDSLIQSEWLLRRYRKVEAQLWTYEMAALLTPNKDLGEGLNTAFQKMKEWRLRDPQITEDGNYVRVTIPHIPLAAPTEAILEFLKTSPTITNRQAREITGIRSENLVKIEFYKLRDEGLLEMVPGLRGPAAAWRLTR